MKKILRFSVAAILLISLVLSGCNRKSGYSVIVEDFFYCLNKYDFQSAAALLGSENAYDSVIEAYTKEYETQLEKVENVNYIEFIYGHVSCNVTGEEIHDDTATVTVEITAYNTDAVFVYKQNAVTKFMSSEEYINADEAEKYIMLCEYIPNIYKDMEYDLTPVTATINLTVSKTENSYVITPQIALFDALSGMM